MTNIFERLEDKKAKDIRILGIFIDVFCTETHHADEKDTFLIEDVRLQDIFSWTYRHVDNFLKALKRDNKITNRMINRMAYRYIVITVVKYNHFQDLPKKSVIQND